MGFFKILRKFQLIKKKKKNFQKYSYLEQIPRFTQTSVKLGGKNILIPDSASFLSMYKDIFEKEIYRFESSNPKPRIIDAGANIGMASIYFKNRFPEAQIIAFEPDPHIYKILTNNIQVFKYSDIVLHQKGLWNKNQILDFFSEGADSGSLKNTITLKVPNRKIEVVSLRPFLVEQIDFLKLDIEGAETMVLKDIEDKLILVKRIFVEYHSFIEEEQSLDVIFEVLLKAGFRLYITAPGSMDKSPFISRRKYNNMDLQLNIFGFREN